MMKITGLSHLFKWENLHNWWLTKYFFAPLYMGAVISYTSKLLQQKRKYIFFRYINFLFATVWKCLFLFYRRGCPSNFVHIMNVQVIGGW